MQKPITPEGSTPETPEMVRERFVAACHDCLRSGAAQPDPDRFLESLPDAERALLRPEFQSIAQGIQTQHAGSDATSQTPLIQIEEEPASDAVSGVEGTVDYISDSPFVAEARREIPSALNADDSLDRPPDSLPAGTADSPANQVPTVAHDRDATVDQQPATDAVTRVLDPSAGAAAPSSSEPSGGSAQAGPSSSARGLRRSKRPPLPGTVAGYEILGILGRGAMGVVYKARQPGLNRLVALKMILSSGHAGDREIGRFLIEAEAVAQLQHPHIVQIYEIGEDDGKPYFSLEYVDGTSLARLIDGKPQAPRKAVELLLQLAQGMVAAHAKGIIHRDLKPANVLVNKDGLAKITDFGLAKKLDAESGQTFAGTVLGTPSYMSPEQAQGAIESVGPLSDVYSLGAILYEMLTGRPPFQGATAFETLDMVKNQEPVGPSQLQANLPHDLETICLKCLHKDPTRRYDSAAALAEDLERYLEGRPILARPVSSAERLLRWYRRNPRLALLYAVVVLLFVVWAGTSSVLAYIANENKKAAEQNKQDAVTQRDRAQANELEAKNNAEAARSRSEHVFEKMVQLGEAMQVQLRSRRVSERLGPDARKLQQSMMNLLRDKMLDLGRELTEANIRNFATAATYQKLGDLLARLGQGTDALRQYEQGFKLIKQVADKEPENDLARANMGMMLMRLGDMALDLNGDAGAASDYYQRGWDLQREIADHPRSSDFTPDKNQILLSHHAVRLGKADLALGHAADAAKHFRTALDYRKSWMAFRSKSPESRSYVAEAYLWLGIAAWHQGKMAEGESNIRQCVDLCENLAKEHPGYVPFEADVADCTGQLGDVLLRRGDVDGAAQAHQRAQKALDAVLALKPDDPQWQPLLALQHERLGTDALLHDQRMEADQHFAQALKIREDLAMLEPNNRVWQAAYALALARAGKRLEALKRASELQGQVSNSADLLLQLARCQATCAGTAATAEERQKVTAGAVILIKAVADLGYRDAAVLQTDPDLARIQSEPGFLAVMARLSLPSR